MAVYSKFDQCHMCKEWSWTVSRSFERCPLCLPCYVDVLEERQWTKSGGKSKVRGRVSAEPVRAQLGEGPDKRPAPEPSRSALVFGKQLDLFGD